MQNNNIPDLSNTLSPSELVLLNGEQFAKKVFAGNIQLLHTEASVSTSQLGEAILTTAFLANEQAGALHFATRQEKALFGLRKVDSLLATPSAPFADWPENSPEATLGSLAAKLSLKGNNDVYTIVYAWLEEDTGSPWQSAIELVKAGLASRGLLETHEEKSMKIFTKTIYTLPESTASLAKQTPIEPVQRLLASCQKNRPDVWELLIKQIKKAIKARTEQDDVDFD